MNLQKFTRKRTGCCGCGENLSVDLTVSLAMGPSPNFGQASFPTFMNWADVLGTRQTIHTGTYILRTSNDLEYTYNGEDGVEFIFYNLDFGRLDFYLRLDSIPKSEWFYSLGLPEGYYAPSPLSVEDYVTTDNAFHYDVQCWRNYSREYSCLGYQHSDDQTPCLDTDSGTGTFIGLFTRGTCQYTGENYKTEAAFYKNPCRTWNWVEDTTLSVSGYGDRDTSLYPCEGLLLFEGSIARA